MNILKVILPVLSKLINKYRVDEGNFSYYQYFDYWQAKGFHLTPVHYYQAIPDTSKLESKIFTEKKKLMGIDMNDISQLKLLESFSIVKDEFHNFNNITDNVDDQEDPQFYFGNLAFDNVDALLYYGLIRHLKPRNVIEVGSGWSTKIAARAVQKNTNTRLTSIEPYPQPILKKGFQGLEKLIEKPVQHVSKKLFTDLKENDILFIDSSHTVKIGGDVNYLFFEILPILKKGVYIHIHDIFFPFDYPKDWVLKEHRFWAEQYLLHAFLMFNNSFEVIYSNSYMYHTNGKQVKKVFGVAPRLHGGSFWMRKIN